MATKIECFLANVMVTLEVLCVTNSQFCEVCHADTKFIHIAKTSRYFVNNSCGCFQILGWWGESIVKSPSARLKLYDFMWTEECHELPELPEFSSYNWAASIGGGDKLSYKSLIEEEYV